MTKCLLTRKQLWRKAFSNLSYEEHYKNYKEYDEGSMFRNDKSVSFDSFVKVILIPGIKEYKNINLDEKLWYSQDDYFGFINDKLKEDKINQEKSKYNSF
tara:strand:+ start:2942 stop:3241 length:300 start_codon:yes stop_codon:yes gene_type:complete